MRMDTFPRSGVSLSTSRINSLIPTLPSVVPPLSFFNARVHISFSSAINHPVLNIDSRYHEPSERSSAMTNHATENVPSSNVASTTWPSTPHIIFTPTTIISRFIPFKPLFQPFPDSLQVHRSTSPSVILTHSLPHTLNARITLALLECTGPVFPMYTFPPLDDKYYHILPVRAYSDRPDQWHLRKFP